MKPFRVLLALCLLGALVGLVALLGIDGGPRGEADPAGLGMPVAFAAGSTDGGGPSCSCSGWTAQGCGKGGCSKTTMYYTQSCSPSGCSSTSYCGSSDACCACTSWQYHGCGQKGCRRNEMSISRKCSPGGCSYTSLCYQSDSCERDPNKVSGNWKQYGFAIPGDPLYSFTYKENEKQDFLALAAKGNVVIGDYTSSQFQGKVVPKLKPGGQSVTQPYVVDPTDSALGYHTGKNGVMYDAQGRPLFDGNYDQADKGAKLDRTPRKFYESTLSDKEFRKLVNPYDPLNYYWGQAKLDGVYFTNHALAGSVNAYSLNVNGSIVARDDVLMFRQNLYLNQDTRLMDESASALALPVSIKRPKLRSWRECPPSGCP